MLLASLSIEEQLEASGPEPTSIGKDSTDDWVLSTETCFDFRTYFLLGLASSPISSSVFFCLFLVFLAFSPLSFPFVVLSVSLSSSSSIASEKDFFSNYSRFKQQKYIHFELFHDLSCISFEDLRGKASY